MVRLVPARSLPTRANPVPAGSTPASAAAMRLALPASILLWALVLATVRRWVCDDAFISFRYADNLVHGLGLVFNAGERVEGFTNFLWTLWIALGMRLGVP